MTEQVGATVENERKFVVAIAASAGGVRALLKLLSALPLNFPAGIVIVQHVSPDYQSHLAEILSHKTPLKVKQAEAGDQITPGTVYVAPPNHHVLVQKYGMITLSETARVHFVRPSADVLFQSIAASFGAQAIVVILTGTGMDGAAGAQQVKMMGGTVIAQDQATSEYFSMPGAVIQTGSVDFILPLDQIGPCLLHLTAGK